jgi:flagellar biosynthesis protein FliQ
MNPERTVEIMRHTIETALWMGAPLLIVATVVSLLINIAQVLTSLQENTIAHVPKLFTVAAAALLIMPWMTRRLVAFTVQVLSDFRPFTR